MTSRSFDDKADITPAFADNPSHNKSVHSFERDVPALLASVKFSIPRITRVLLPSVFFAFFSSFTWVRAHAVAITPSFATFSINASVTVGNDPNFAEGKSR